MARLWAPRGAREAAGHRHTGASMKPPISEQKPGPSVARPLRLYALGHGALLVGAWAMDLSGSMLPMALAASACLMLTVPLVRHFMQPAAAQGR